MSAIHNINDFEKAIFQTVEAWKKQIIKGDFLKINLLLLEEITIEYFGSKTAIKYLVNIKKNSQGEIHLIPFDSKMLNTIHKAIDDFKVDWNLSIQGKNICITLPLITTQKKDLIIKNWKIQIENNRIHLRKLRHQLLKYLKNEEKLAKEELSMEQKKIQKIIDINNQKMEEILKEKIDELLKV